MVVGGPGHFQTPLVASGRQLRPAPQTGLEAMNPHDRSTRQAPGSRLVAAKWEARKGGRVARCDRWLQPLGWELRCDVDGETRQTAVQRRRETAEDMAHDWIAGFEKLGLTR